jgi:hypothetical protein
MIKIKKVLTLDKAMNALNLEGVGITVVCGNPLVVMFEKNYAWIPLLQAASYLRHKFTPFPNPAFETDLPQETLLEELKKTLDISEFSFVE